MCPIVNALLFKSARAFLKREKLSVGIEGGRWVEGGKVRDREGEKGGWERVRGVWEERVSGREKKR